jgi:hypothetical protein
MYVQIGSTGLNDTNYFLADAKRLEAKRKGGETDSDEERPKKGKAKTNGKSKR